LMLRCVFQEQRHDQGLDFPSTLPPLRRAKSLDRRTTESVMTPDLLNFKKGWMVKLDEHGQWTKFWFVLTDHSLQYYKDSIAEEASDLDGEIDLSTCYNVTEYQAQRNYGFQIHTREGLHTLSAMTAGIRRNWIQAVMKNVRPSTAPDGLDSPSSETSSVEREPGPGPKKSRARERRQQGRSKTFDWGEFRPIAQALAQQRAQKAEPLQTDIGDPDRNRRREERRRRYESVTGSSKDQPAGCDGGRMDFEKGGGSEGSPGGEQQKVEVEIEQRWQQVEQTPIRDERRVTLPSTLQTRETAKLEKLLESYKKGVGVEELKLQLGSCHQQLLHSNQHKQNLEVQLRTALEREQHVRSGYVSQLDLPLVLEADIEPQTKRPELVSSQAQSLARKYQETKELLQLQELKKRNMQAQLGLSLSHLSIKELYLSHPQTTAPLESLPSSEPLVKKTVSFLIEDSADRIQELEDLISGKSLTLKGLVRLLRSHSEFCLEGSLEIGQQGSWQRLLESWKFQQEVDNETMMQSLARAGESIHSYESCLLAMEDMLGRVQKVESQKTPYGPLCQIEDHSESHEIAVRALSHRVELLKSENGALNQRYQEIVNQLTEADREIDRLKAELINLQGGKQHLLILEELNGRELNEKSVKLHEALVTLEATLKGLGFQMAEEGAPKEKGQLKEQQDATVAKLLKKENLCRELQTQNVELQARNQESERVQSLKLLEAENEIRMLRAKEVNVSEDLMQTGERKIADKSVIKQVVGEIKMKSEALSRVLEVLVKLDVSVEKTLLDLKSSLHITDCLGSFGEEPDEVSQRVMKRLVLDAAFWSGLLNALEVSPCETEGERVCSFEMRMEVDNKMTVMAQTMQADLLNWCSWLDNDTNTLILKDLTEALQEKVYLFNLIASTIEMSTNDTLLSLVLASFDSGKVKKQWSEHLQDAATEAHMAYLISRLNFQHEKELKETQVEKLQIGNSDYTRPVTHIQIEGEPIDSMDKAIQLQDMVAKHKLELRETKDVYTQVTEKLRQEVAKVSEILRLEREENVKEIDSLTVCMENLKKKHETERIVLLEKLHHQMDVTPGGSYPTGAEDGTMSPETSTTSALKERIQELVAQVSAMTEEMKRRELQGDAANLRLKYDKDLENLKPCYPHSACFPLYISILWCCMVTNPLLVHVVVDATCALRNPFCYQNIAECLKRRHVCNAGASTPALLAVWGLRLVVYYTPATPLNRKWPPRTHLRHTHTKQRAGVACCDVTVGSAPKYPAGGRGGWLSLKGCSLLGQFPERWGLIPPIIQCSTRSHLNLPHSIKTSPIETEWTGRLSHYRRLNNMTRYDTNSICNGCFMSETARISLGLKSWQRLNTFTVAGIIRLHRTRPSQSHCVLAAYAFLQRIVYSATCERGFAAMEESHQRVIEELQRKNQRALENLHEEKERLLAEETAATIAAIEAMKNAHRSELEKELDKARKSNSNTENADIEEICRQHE
ncbi:unnamed protein product, partial [Oncorhynchus mykiss]